MSEHDRPTGDPVRLSRRALLAAAAGVAGTAGCLGGDSDNDSEAPEEIPAVEDPPEAVYTPTHREPMLMNRVVTAGDYALLPHLSYPHRFWLVNGPDTEAVLPTLDDGAHLMLTVWDRETGELVPVDAGTTLDLRLDGDPVETVAPWPMLSQTMGFHFGDNVPLPEDGSYTAEVTLNPLDGIRTTGTFAGRFEETASTSFEFEWSDNRRRNLVQNVEYLPEDRWGDPGALEPMTSGDSEMAGGAMPAPSLPPPESYPGANLGVHESGDARFVVRYLEDSRLATEGYLLVSPRTPYNRLPLPDMSLSVSASGSGTQLTQTLDDELGMHYGTPTTLSSGETVELVVESPPQIARHRGYETAFLEMPPMTVEVVL